MAVIMLSSTQRPEVLELPSRVTGSAWGTNNYIPNKRNINFNTTIHDVKFNINFYDLLDK